MQNNERNSMFFIKCLQEGFNRTAKPFCSIQQGIRYLLSIDSSSSFSE